MRSLYLIPPLLALALATPAQGDVTMDPLKPCYVSDGERPDQRETIHVHATGFTPLAALTLSIDGTPVAGGMSGTTGEAEAFVPAPFEGLEQHDFTLGIQENQIPENLAVATSTVTNLTVRLRPRKARPSRRVRISGRGFTLAAPVYGHYLFGGKLRRTVRLASASTLPCGTFSAHHRQIPVRRPAPGNWTLQVDQQRKYAEHPATNAQRVTIRVRET